MIIEQFTDEAGFIRIVWQASPDKAINLKFQTLPDESEIERLALEIVEQEALQSIEPINVTIDPEIALMFAEKCRAEPGLTSGQYNTWAAVLGWDQEAEVRFFVSEFAKEMQRRGSLSITSPTENAHMQAARDYINSVSPQVYAKLIGV